MINLIDTFLCNDNPWCLMFGVVLENIWWRRNQVVFQACMMDNKNLFCKIKMVSTTINSTLTPVACLHDVDSTQDFAIHWEL
jgi:hypothetical protein